MEAGSSSLFFNPAGMARMENFIDISASNNQWIADIKYLTLSLAINPFHGNYGVIGFSVQSVNYGDFLGTRVNKSVDKGYDELGIFSPSAIAIGVGYAKQLTDRFSVGAQVRWAKQDLGESIIPNLYAQIPIYADLDTGHTTILGYRDSSITASNKLTPFIFDFGTQFNTGFKSLVFGMSVRNFSQEMKYAYENFQLPLTFTLGISMDLMDLIEKGSLDQSLIMCIDASHYRDHPEQMKVGLEYRIMKLLAVRCGYVTNADERTGWSFGVGFSQVGFSVDYSYTPYGIFDKVQRLTGRFSY
jgi:hypothetical protein